MSCHSLSAPSIAISIVPSLAHLWKASIRRRQHMKKNTALSIHRGKGGARPISCVRCTNNVTRCSRTHLTRQQQDGCAKWMSAVGWALEPLKSKQYSTLEKIVTSHKMYLFPKWCRVGLLACKLGKAALSKDGQHCLFGTKRQVAANPKVWHLTCQG